MAWAGSTADAPYPFRQSLDVSGTPKCFKNLSPALRGLFLYFRADGRPFQALSWLFRQVCPSSPLPLRISLRTRKRAKRVYNAARWGFEPPSVPVGALELFHQGEANHSKILAKGQH